MGIVAPMAGTASATSSLMSCNTQSPSAPTRNASTRRDSGSTRTNSRSDANRGVGHLHLHRLAEHLARRSLDCFAESAIEIRYDPAVRAAPAHHREHFAAHELVPVGLSVFPLNVFGEHELL